MNLRTWLAFALAAAILLPPLSSPGGKACCPAPPSGKPVVNADQTVVIVWDAATKTEHFIRKASFKSEADDFGFLVPTPTQPELEESGNEAFPYLLKLTEPEIKVVRRPSGISCGCAKKDKSESKEAPDRSSVHVRVEKEVAGFHAVVLETRSAKDLVKWLKENGYAFTPEVEAWAKPYVEGGWMIAAFKVAKPKDGKDTKSVTASALRMTFKTDRPLFPYREPDPRGFAKTLGARGRLLRIYFLADQRYEGELSKEATWGDVAWANKLSAESRKKTLELLSLPATTGPGEWWLTEFEHRWPYRAAPADVYFSPSSIQDPVKRDPIIKYAASAWPGDVTAYAIAGIIVLPPLWRRVRRGRRAVAAA